MSSLVTLQQRLAQAVSAQTHPVAQAVATQLAAQHYRANLRAPQVRQWVEQFGLSPVELALHCLPLAACYAQVPVSQFYVGAVAIGESGDFFFGANQEFAHTAMQQTVHAEQSAISHAWLAGEKAVTDIVVNHTPCGHCRQFMNELNSAPRLKIHLPHSRDNLLHHYLPDDFGPKDLQVERLLFDAQQHAFESTGDALTQAAIRAAQHAYAPYSHAVSGVALQAGSQIITGRYAENAAFNPSFLPLQSALNQRRLLGLWDDNIQRIVFAEKHAVLSHRKITEDLARVALGLEVDYLVL